jgi:glutamine synthetase
MRPKAPKELMAEAKEKKVEFIQLEFVDMHGRPKRVTIHVNMLGEALEEGIGFDGSSVPSYARIERSDLVLLPDPRTFRVLPWKHQDKTVAKLFCGVCLPDGTPHECDPRHVLDREAGMARKQGYEFLVGSEMEFYLFKKKGKKLELLDTGKYLDYPPHDKGEEIRLDLAIMLQKLGFGIEKIHHEVNPGQHEVDFRFANALTTADDVVTCRQALEALAEQKGLKVDYGPKPMPDAMGNGLHCHLSLSDSGTGENLFYDPKGEYHMSELARCFMAGQLEHARALTALAASVPESYKRLVPGFEAPVYISWGGPNRSVMIRVPGFELRRGKGVRLEFRIPDPVCNPYLLFTGLLAAGLDGIKKKMDPGPPVLENVYKMSEDEKKRRKIKTLPSTLDEALDALESDEIIKRALGEKMCEAYVRIKREEAVS